MQAQETECFRFGRSVSDRGYGRRYVAEDQIFGNRKLDKDLFVWFDESKWSFVPDFRNRRVAIIANSEIRGQGHVIDSFDEVIRLNSMKYWLRSAEDDGVRATMWAGLPWACFIPDNVEKNHTAALTRIRFQEIVQEVRLIWSATPFYISARFVDFLRRNGAIERLFISGSGLYFYDYLMGRVPADMFRALFTIRDFVLPNGLPNLQFNFELLLTGVRVVFFCALGGAREIGLFGFNFYEGAAKRPWAAHDLSFNRAFLDRLTQVAADWGCRISATANSR
jgi:hypothetical protein